MDYKSFAEVDKLTIPEYNLLMKAADLKSVDMDYRIHQQAFLNFQVQAKKKAGKGKTKPVYSKFSKFYNYKEEVKKALDRKKAKTKFSGVGKFLKKGE